MIRLGTIEAYISDVVLTEIRKAPKGRDQSLMRIVEGYPFTILDITEGVLALAEKYIREGIIPRRYENDALHIAVAVVHGMDSLISWNFRHIVKPETRRKVNAVNRLLGYGEIDLSSPEEVVH